MKEENEFSSVTKFEVPFNKQWINKKDVDFELEWNKNRQEEWLKEHPMTEEKLFELLK